MAVLRRNILSDTDARDKFIRGITLLKHEDSGKTTNDFAAAGPAQPLGTYDLFVVWHHNTMMTATPPTIPHTERNAAHAGPIFLPWHRVMLLVLERNLQRVLGDTNFGLPYWDWAADGDHSGTQDPRHAQIWSEDYLGELNDPVGTGPFSFSKDWRVRVHSNTQLELNSVDRALSRAAAVPGLTLPTTQHVTNALEVSPYDSPDWKQKAPGFRSRLEGFTSEEPAQTTWLHNRVHAWIGGDMIKPTSPNDPAFYLNHCNVDRYWESWLRANGRDYLPDMSAGEDLKGHRIDDPIVSPLGGDATPRQVLDVSAIYTYDALP